ACMHPLNFFIKDTKIDRAKPIIEPIRELINEIKKTINKKDEIQKTIKEKFEPKINLDTRKEIKTIRTRPTSNIQFSLEIVEDEDEPFSIQMEQNLDRSLKECVIAYCSSALAPKMIDPVYSALLKNSAPEA
ncbi:hypothetical protein, partial [Enterobacter hormaechei]|uniref:hypothetical protein n=1 Tax=Enterobacter hormaechei TaxID=158836 RepID=UPI0023E364F9